MPNLWISSNNNEVLNKKMLAQEQKSRVMKELFKIADQELRENDQVRKQCLEHLREWIQQNTDIENCITDDSFLLRFLRVKKFSIPMAQQMLLKYLNYRKKFRRIMYEMDYKDPKMYQLISDGYIFVSPFRDSHGRRIIIYDLSKFDVNIYSGADMARAHIITYETLMEDDENQILGVNHVADIGAVSAQFLTLFSISEFSYLIRWGEQSFPMRHKEMNMINLPVPLKYVYDFAKSNMSQKLRDRFMIHNSKEDLHKQVDRRSLPTEFGGEMPAEEMVEIWKEELALKRKRLLSYDKINLLNDKGIITRKNPLVQDESGSLPGSFRKLELD